VRDMQQQQQRQQQQQQKQQQPRPQDMSQQQLGQSQEGFGLPGGVRFHPTCIGVTPSQMVPAHMYVACVLVALISLAAHTPMASAALTIGSAGHTLNAPLTVYGNVTIIDSSGRSSDLLQMVQQQAAQIQLLHVILATMQAQLMNGWLSYNPVVTSDGSTQCSHQSSGGTPTLRYTLLGKMCFLRGEIEFGLVLSGVGGSFIKISLPPG
jgi:hypothetical protein